MEYQAKLLICKNEGKIPDPSLMKTDCGRVWEGNQEEKHKGEYYKQEGQRALGDSREGLETG